MKRKSRDIVVAADVHFCKSWDEIAAVVPDKVSFRNPNKIFRDFVESFDRDKLFVLNGDIVDYMFTDYFFETLQSNWTPVLKCVKRE